MATINVNGKDFTVNATPDTPLLWLIREQVGLTGTKFGCGGAYCGACTVHMDGEAVRSCVTPLSRAEGKTIVTIEGIDDNVAKRVQKAWVDIDVPQCGYCQSGQIMAATILLRSIPNPTDDDIDKGMSANICRCGTYQRVKQAIHTAAKMK